MKGFIGCILYIVALVYLFNGQGDTLTFWGLMTIATIYMVGQSIIDEIREE